MKNNFSSVQERHIPDAAPKELVILCGRFSTKMSRRWRWGKVGRVSPLRAGRPQTKGGLPPYIFAPLAAVSRVCSVRKSGKKIHGRKIGERDPIFLPSMFLPFLPASSRCFKQANDDRNIAARKMLVHDLPIFLSSIFLSLLPPETKERKFEEVVKSAEQAAVLVY